MRATLLTREVAVKVLPVRDDFEQERKVLSAMPPHPNLVEFVGATMREPPFQGFLVFDFYKLGSLERLIYADKALSGKLSLCIVREIVAGMRHLHDHAILHLDLKPQNVLIASVDE